MKYYDELEVGELDSIEDNFISLIDDGVRVSVSQVDPNDKQIWIKIYIEFGFDYEVMDINRVVNSAVNRLTNKYHIIRHIEDIIPPSLRNSFPHLLSSICIMLRKK